jgi:hypothetical protein
MDEFRPGGVARRQGSPYTGKCSARPAGKPGDCLLALEHLRRSLRRHSIPAATSATGALGRRFQGMAESIWSDRVSKQTKTNSKPTPGSGPYRLPLVGPGPREKNAPGGSRSFASSADEFRPAIPRSGWSPPEPVSASPALAEYHEPPRGPRQRGHFYFASEGTFLLCLDTCHCATCTAPRFHVSL